MASEKPATLLCGVMGHPVNHSLSPVMHNAGYRAAGIDFEYRAYDVTDVEAFLTKIRAQPSFRGLSVTIPHKVAVIEHLDALEPRAERVGSVNTITHAEGRLVGDSTDGPGTVRAFAESGIELRDQNVLFTGGGGAVRAVAFAVADEGASRITLLARNPAKLESLAADLRANSDTAVSTGHLESAGTALNEHGVLIQGTPLGMAPEHEGVSCIPANALQPEHTVLDMVYRPRETRLILDARAAGCTVITGESMLLHQGAIQFERWTGHPAPVEAMRRVLLDALT